MCIRDSLLRLAGARWPWPLVWMLTCAAVVALDPWALLQPGFWLSFVAVGVLFATDSGAARAESMGAGGRFLSMLREQGVITLALAPLTFLLFGQLSVIGLLANLLAIPWVTLVLTPLALLGSVLPPLWGLAAQASELMWWCLSAMAGWPGATLSLPLPPLGWGVLAVAGGMLLSLIHI